MAGLEQFVGCWHEQTKEGFDEMANALGLPDAKKDLYKNNKTSISYSCDGDTWTINVGSVGMNGSREFKFKLGEPYQSADLDGTAMQSLVTADGSKLVEKHTNESGLEMNIVRWIENGSMLVQTSCHGMSMLSRYSKV